MSLLFAILFALLHKTDEFAEQIRAVLRTRCAFGVILHTEYLILFAGNTLDRIIEYVYMCYGEIGVFNAFGIYRVIVILACDLDFTRFKVFNGVISASVTEFQLVCLCAVRKIYELVTKTDSEDRVFSPERFYKLDRFGNIFRVAGAV